MYINTNLILCGAKFIGQLLFRTYVQKATMNKNDCLPAVPYEDLILFYFIHDIL